MGVRQKIYAGYKDFFSSEYMIVPTRKSFDFLMQNRFYFDALFGEQYQFCESVRNKIDYTSKHVNFAMTFVYGSLCDEVINHKNNNQIIKWITSYGYSEYNLARNLNVNDEKIKLFSSAVEHFKTSKEFGNDFPINARAIGKSYLQLHDYENAEKYLTIAWENGDHNSRTAGFLGKALIKQKKFEDALVFFTLSNQLGDNSTFNLDYILDCKERILNENNLK